MKYGRTHLFVRDLPLVLELRIPYRIKLCREHFHFSHCLCPEEASGDSTDTFPLRQRKGNDNAMMMFSRTLMVDHSEKSSGAIGTINQSGLLYTFEIDSDQGLPVFLEYHLILSVFGCVPRFP